MRLSAQAAVLLTIVLAGAVARLDGMTFGFPDKYHPDEWGASKAVSKCSRGLTPERAYHYPPLHVNLGCVTDRVLRPLTSRIQRMQPHDVFALRMVSVAAGTATIAFVYLLALPLISAPAALGAAFLFACFPVSVVASKYGVPDSLLTMLIVAALWLQLRILERGDRAAYFQAALATTLAVAAKYNAGFLAFSFVAAHLCAARTRGRPVLDRDPILTSIGAIVLGLAVGFPQVLFGGEAPKLVHGVMGEGDHLLAAGHFGFELGGNEGSYLFHFRHSILPAAGPLLLALIVAGVVVLALQWSAPALVLLAFAVPYYVAIEMIYKVPPSYERYVLPLLPLYTIAAALVLDRIAGLVRRDSRDGSPLRSVVFALLLLVAAWVPLARSIRILGSINNDTRTSMRLWLKGNQEPLELDNRLYAQWPMLQFYYPRAPDSLALKPLERHANAVPKTAYVLTSSFVYDRYVEFPEQAPEWTRFYEHLFADGTLVHEEDAGAGRFMFQNPTVRLYRVDGAWLRENMKALQKPPARSQPGDNTKVRHRSPSS